MSHPHRQKPVQALLPGSEKEIMRMSAAEDKPQQANQGSWAEEPWDCLGTVPPESAVASKEGYLC